MVDRPHVVDPQWLARIEEVYGDYQLVAMTKSGERGIACQMWVAADSLSFLRRRPEAKEIQAALRPLQEARPNPILKVRWNGKANLWQSEFWIGLPPELQAVFQRRGYGCFAGERDDVVAFITHLPDDDIASSRSAPVLCHWELIEMPSAALIRFHAAILDDPASPYALEHFLNIGDPEQAKVLARLVQQEELAFDFFGDVYEYHYSKHFEHPADMRAQLAAIVRRAQDYWLSIPAEDQDFDRAKAEFQHRFPV